MASDIAGGSQKEKPAEKHSDFSCCAKAAVLLLCMTILESNPLKCNLHFEGLLPDERDAFFKKSIILLVL